VIATKVINSTLIEQCCWTTNEWIQHNNFHSLLLQYTHTKSTDCI